jgi:hypothetical protein
VRTLPDRQYFPRQDKLDRARLLPYGARNHPAKMYVSLALDLVERYTLPGHHILDPCFGIGGTAVALLKGRHVTGIELEEHHHRDALANANHISRIARDFGKGGAFAVIQGDAREHIPWLVNHAKEAVITSSAFGEMNAPHRGGDITQRPTKDGTDFEGGKEQFVYGGHRQENLDGTLFSPPFLNARTEETLPSKGSPNATGDVARLLQANGEYADRSTPVDVGLFSPAYTNQEVAPMDNVSVADHLKRGERANDAMKGGKGYGATLPLSEFQQIVDAHLLSPAYGEQMPDQGDPQVGVERIKRKVEAGKLHHPEGTAVGRRTAWGGGTQRSYTHGYGVRAVDAPGGPDTILTSPAYEATASRDRHLEPHAQASPYGERYGKTDPSRSVGGYGKNPAQIGNMRLKDNSYQDAMRSIYKECLHVTRPGGVLVTVTGNYLQGGHFEKQPDGTKVYTGGEMVDLAEITIALCVEAGWTPVERWRAVKRNKTGTPAVSFWRTTQAKQGMPLIDYEDVLIFCRGEKPGWDFQPLDGGKWPG